MISLPLFTEVTTCILATDKYCVCAVLTSRRRLHPVWCCVRSSIEPTLQKMKAGSGACHNGCAPASAQLRSGTPHALSTRKLAGLVSFASGSRNHDIRRTFQPPCVAALGGDGGADLHGYLLQDRILTARKSVWLLVRADEPQTTLSDLTGFVRDRTWREGDGY